MPLRHLVVYVDPKSRTSPLPILERFEDYITFEVVDWDYADAYSEAPPDMASESIHADPRNRKLVGEQLKFYEDCMRFYRRRNWKGWITLHDTDEYVSINPLARNADAGIHLPGVPSNTEPGSVMKWLQMTMGHRVERRGSHTPCVGVPRMQFCTEDAEPATSSTTSQLGPGFEDRDFSTLRWSSFPKKDGHRAPKNLVYVGGIDAEYFENVDMLSNGARPHDVMPGVCESHRVLKGSPFQIYHYSGTQEQRDFRADPRGQFGNRPGSPPADDCGPPKDRIRVDDVKPWLGAFVEKVGRAEAARLLQGVGKVSGWPEYAGRTPRTIGRQI